MEEWNKGHAKETQRLKRERGKVKGQATAKRGGTDGEEKLEENHLGSRGGDMCRPRKGGGCLLSAGWWGWKSYGAEVT